MKLGLNGMGRIGKLSLWHHVSRKHFSELVVNVGREIGQGLDDLAASVERDSSFGRLGTYLHGHRGGRVIEELKSQGVAIIYISHRLEEVKELSDYITILRDAKFIDSGKADKFPMNEIIKKWWERTRVFFSAIRKIILLIMKSLRYRM